MRGFLVAAISIVSGLIACHIATNTENDIVASLMEIITFLSCFGFVFGTIFGILLCIYH